MIFHAGCPVAVAVAVAVEDVEAVDTVRWTSFVFGRLKITGVQSWCFIETRKKPPIVSLHTRRPEPLFSTFGHDQIAHDSYQRNRNAFQDQLCDPIPL